MTSPSSAEDAPPRTRRRPGAGPVLAIALAITLLGIAAAWLVPPLGKGDGGVAAGPPGSEQTTDTATGAAEIRYVPSGEVRFGVIVRNTTFVPVTVDGLADLANSYLLEDARAVLGTDPTYLGLEEDHVRAFTPITLWPGDAQLIGVVGRFPTCADARPNWTTGTGVTIGVMHLDARVAGVLPVQVEVPLLLAVDLLGDADAACPRP